MSQLEFCDRRRTAVTDNTTSEKDFKKNKKHFQTTLLFQFLMLPSTLLRNSVK